MCVLFLRAHYWAACLTQSIILCLQTRRPINNLCWLFWKHKANLFKCTAKIHKRRKKSTKEKCFKYWFSRFSNSHTSFKSSQNAILLSTSASNMHMQKNIENCCIPKTRKINGLDAMYVVCHWDVDGERKRKRKPIVQNQWKSWERNHDINKFQIKVILLKAKFEIYSKLL